MEFKYFTSFSYIFFTRILINALSLLTFGCLRISSLKGTTLLGAPSIPTDAIKIILSGEIGKIEYR